MKFVKSNRKKSKAQAMVEFAIALPLLLALLYGILEAGRLLFLYSTVVTASRQAVRYGSATGEGNNSVKRYQDCDGIRAAAQQYSYLGAFDTITIKHDDGVTTGSPPQPIKQQTYCSGSFDTGFNPTGNGNRVTVTVTEPFKPLVPKLVPFAQRDISATSSRTILVSVAVVVEQPAQAVIQDNTIIEIDSDEPDASDTGGWVTVLFTVTDTDDPTNPPTGDVVITGADTNCTYTLVASDNGIGSCNIQFTSSGVKQIVATYSGDDEHLASDTAEAHTVTLATTVTTIILDTPDPSVKNGNVTVTVTVTGGSTTPTGTVAVTVSGNNNCTVTLVNGAGSCTLNFNQLGSFTITATYAGDSSHLGSSDTEPHQVLDGTATPSATSLPPTITLTPTATLPATPTFTPTITPTRVPSCTNVTHGPITKSGNTMSITITNPYSFPLTLQDITVTWNNDKGHQSGKDKSLILQDASLGGTSFWTGNIDNQATYTISATPVINAGSTVTLSFTFQQSYDNFDGTEDLYINFLTPGCENNPINT